MTKAHLMVLCSMIYSCLVTQNCSIQKMGEYISEVNKKDSESGVKQARRWFKMLLITHIFLYNPSFSNDEKLVPSFP